jgi:hypothetical protein
MQLFKKVLPITFLFFIFVLPCRAADSVPVLDHMIGNEQAKEEGNNLEAWDVSHAVISNTNLLAALGGFNETDLQVLKNNPQEFFAGVKNGKYLTGGGVFGLTNQAIAALYTPQASGIDYLARLKDNFLGKPAYAQGFGFSGLAPILPIWRTFRNMVYIFSSLLFVIVGIMIMLRVKISPQAVVTLQNAIPRIISTLLFITFSYAIAGLLIDLSQLIQSVFLAALFDAEGRNLGQSLFATPITSNTDFQRLSTGGMGVISDLTWRLIPKIQLILFPLILAGILALIPATLPAAPFVAMLGPILLILVLVIVLLYWMFKFYFGCLKCYVSIIFKIILAPFELALGSFPQSKMGFSTWVWDLIANIAVFPISILFLVIANILIDKTQSSLWGLGGDGIWAPPMITTGLQGVLIGGVTGGQFVSVGIGLTAAMIVSKLPELVPQAIFQLKPSLWEKAIGETMDFSRNPAYRLAKSTALNQAANQVASGQGPIGSTVAYVASKVAPAGQVAVAEGLKTLAK